MSYLQTSPIEQFKQAATDLAEKIFLSFSASAGRDLAKELTSDAQIQAKNIIDALWEPQNSQGNFYDTVQRLGGHTFIIDKNDKVSDAVILNHVKQYMEELGYSAHITQTEGLSFLHVTHPHPKTLTCAEMFEMASRGKAPRDGIAFPPNTERPDVFKAEQPRRRD